MATKNIETQEAWKVALAQLEVKLDNPTTFKTWISPTQLLEINNGTAILGVRDHYHAEWLRKKYHQMIEQTLSYVYKDDLDVEYKVSSSLANTAVPTIKETKKTSLTPSLLDLESGSSNNLYDALVRAKLNPKYSFENFVIGESNKMAHAAAVAVANQPGVAYNPYFVYGHTGLGKTHLTHAIGRRMLERNPDKHVIYISAEGFMNEMVKAIRNNKNIQFREKYRDMADLLIIDDVQFMATYEKTQTEFFNTFNVLQAANKQIVLISDRSPDELESLTPRLRSRFQGGIVVDVARPEYEHRIAILERKLQTTNSEMEDEYIEFIAKSVVDNIRELEGALQKVMLLKSIRPDIPLSQEEIAKHLGLDVYSKRRKIPSQEVLKRVAKEFDIKLSDLKGNRRTAEIALARQICMYILRQELNYKLEEIAKILERKDHTTVMHGIEKITSKRLTDEAFRDQLVQIIEGLQAND